MFINTWLQWLNTQVKARDHRSKRERRRCQDRYSRRYKPALEYLEDRCAPAVLAVTGTGDDIAEDGFVTLREALTSANNNANVAIHPSSALFITGTVIIDGYSQPGAPSPNTLDVGDDAVLKIEIDFSSILGAAFIFRGGGSTVRRAIHTGPLDDPSESLMRAEH